MDQPYHAAAASPPTPWERLRFIISELQMTLDLLSTGDSLRPGVASPELIHLLLKYLKEVEGLRARGSLRDTGSAADAVWRDYRLALERMQRVLPKLEQQLRSDRSRLALEQSRLGRATSWLDATKLTR